MLVVLVATAAAASSTQDTRVCVRSACREFTPMTPGDCRRTASPWPRKHLRASVLTQLACIATALSDEDCCGSLDSTFCAPNFTHSKVLSTFVGGTWVAPKGFEARCPRQNGGNTCCTPGAPDANACVEHACRRAGHFDPHCCGPQEGPGAGDCADGYVKEQLSDPCGPGPQPHDMPHNVRPWQRHCCKADPELYNWRQSPEGELCPADTLRILFAGMAVGLCDEDGCSTDITYALCKDWGACRAALVSRWGEEAGTKTDKHCTKAVEAVAGIAAGVVVASLTLCALGFFIGLAQQRRIRRRAAAEERAGLTSAAPPQQQLGELPPAPSQDPLDRIENLKKLLDAGALKEDEFEAKKVELLARV